MPPGVRRATIADIPAMAATLARAFAHDPYYLLLAGDAPERNQRMRDGWSGILRFGSAKLTDTYTTDDHAGVALWLPPGHGGPSVIDSLRMMPAIGRLSGWRRLRKVSNLIAELETRHRHHMPTPHFYLSALGVEPDRQGEGIGTALMKPVLDRCDRDQVPAYLETATARNVLLYERLGFDVVEELTLPTTDVHGWLMARAARPSTRAQRAPRQAPA
ncbi:MAG: GNAT family N-acetyltransferase [Candidatus Limnocylindria bacterium]